MNKSFDKVEAVRNKCPKHETLIRGSKQDYYKSQWQELKLSCLQNNDTKFCELLSQGQRELKVIIEAQISPEIWISYFKNKTVNNC